MGPDSEKLDGRYISSGRESSLQAIKDAIRDGVRYFLFKNGAGLSDKELSDIARACKEAKEMRTVKC